MHYLTLSWDDGFLESSLKTAEIFESFGLRAEFNVIATAGQVDNDLPPDMKPGRRWGGQYGDFSLWNELQARGHVIQPHGYRHADKSALPFRQARGLILKCLEVFSDRLAGFQSKRAIFAFPYNRSSPDLETWLPKVVRAYRIGGSPAINPLPSPETVRLITVGGEEAEEYLEVCLSELLAQPEGWLLYTCHGLDGEGWGSMSNLFLSQLLEKLTALPELSILPAVDIIDRAVRH